jgi:O-antigen/teichoic acid export membrane protein
MTTNDTAERVFLNTASSWVANGAGMVVGFLLTPFLLDQLKDERYGLYSLATSISSWLCFIAVPIGTYASRYATEYREQHRQPEMNRVLGTALGLATAGATLCLGVVILFSVFADHVFHLSPELQSPARNAILIVGLGGAFTIFLRVWESSLYMTRKFYLRHWTEASSRVLGALLVVLYFYWFGASVNVWLTIIVWLPPLTSFLIAAPLARRGTDIRIRLDGFDRTEAQQAMRFCLVFALSSLGSLLFDATDSIVVSKMPELGLSQVAAYDFGARWYRQITPLLLAFGTALGPYFVARAARNEMADFHRTFIAGTRYCILLAFIPVFALALAARPFIHYWVGEGYLARSVPVMWIQLGSVIMMIPGMFAYHVMLAVVRYRYYMVASIASGVINLVLSISFVRFFGLGLNGVALGTLVPLTLVSGFYMPFLACRYSGLSFRQYLLGAWTKPILAAAGIAAVDSLIVCVWNGHSLTSALVLVCTMMVTSLPIIFLLGLTPTERSTVMVRMGKYMRLARAA